MYYRADSGRSPLTENYILNCDIDLTNVQWEMPTMYGSFDGKGHKITGFNTSITTPKNVSIFSANYGTIKNLVVENMEVFVMGTGTVKVGGIVIENKGEIYYCKVTGKFLANVEKGNIYLGGIAAENEGHIFACYTDTIQEAISTITPVLLYGIAKNNSGIIEHCYTKGSFNGYPGGVGLGSIGMAGVSNIAENSFSLVNITCRSYNKNNVFAVAKDLQACTSQTINGTAQSGISENFLKSETYLTNTYGWKKYIDDESIKNDKYAVWKFSGTDYPTLYFE